MQRVAEAGRVVYIDDSKATTVVATQAALDGIERPAVLIAGGDGKGQDFRPLKSSVDADCRAVLLIGRDAPLIARALEGTPAPRGDRRHARRGGRPRDRARRARRRRAAVAGVREPRPVRELRRARRALRGARARAPRGDRAPCVRRSTADTPCCGRRSSGPRRRAGAARAASARAHARGLRRLAHVGGAAAARDRPRDGVLVVDRDGRGVGAHRLSRVVLPRAARDVRRRRPCRRGRRVPGADARVAEAGAVALHRRRRAARARARARHRQVGQRLAPLAVARRRQRAAVGVHEARGRAVRGELRGAPRRVPARRAAAEADDPARLPAAVRRDGASPADCCCSSRTSARSSSSSRSPSASCSWAASTGGCSSGLALLLPVALAGDPRRGAVSPAAPDGVPRSVVRSARQGLSALAFADRVRARRMVRRRARRRVSRSSCSCPRRTPISCSR